MAILMIDEHAHRRRFYKQYASRFRPFDAITSRLFATLEAEEEEQKKELMPLIHEALGNDTLSLKSACGARHTGKTDADADQQNFFVITTDMAKALLQAALQMEDETYDFYEGLCAKAKYHPLLKRFFKHLNLFVENHKQTLEEALDCFHSQAPLHHLSRAKKPINLN
jgi:hypothetical protein